MRSTRRVETASWGSLSTRLGEWLPFAFLVAALLLGGAGNSYPLAFWMVAMLALVVLAWRTPRMRWSALDTRTKAVACVTAASVALFIVQLVPLPRAIWEGMAGHGLAAQIASTVGGGGWTAWSLAPDRTLVSLLSWLPPVAAMVIMARAPSDQRRKILRLVLIVALVSAVLSIVQLAAGPGSAPVAFSTRHRGYGVGLFVNRNHLALFLLLAMQIAALPGVLAARTADETGRGMEWGLRAGSLALLSLGVLATLSRTGCSLLPVALASAIFLSQRKRIRVGILLGVLGGAAVAALLLRNAPPVAALLGRFATAAEDKRFEYWANTLAATKDSLPWGTGFGTFQLIYPTMEPLTEVAPDVVNHAHSDLLEVALEGGVLGVILMLAWVGVLVWTIMRARQGAVSRFERVAPLAVAVALVLTLGASAVDYPLRMTTVSVTVALFVGLLLPVRRSAESEGTAGREEPGGVARWRVWAPIAVLAVLVSSAFWSERLVLARQEAAATMVAPWSSRAQASAATRFQMDGSAAEASLAARRALAISPLDPAAVRAQGMAEIVRGRGEEGAALMSLGATLGWRDRLTQLWLVEQALAANAYGFAVQRVDGLLRQGQFADYLLPLLPGVLTQAEGRAALAEQLSFAPGWRAAFFNTLARDRTWELSDLQALADQLRRAGEPVTPSETALIRAVLAEQGQFDQIRRVWQLSGQRVLVGDGEFEGQSGELPIWAAPYGWRAPQLSGVRVEVAEPVKPRRGQALVMTSEGVARGPALAQTVVLAPGRYNIQLAALAPDIPILRGLQARIARVHPGEAPGAPAAVPIAWSAVANEWSTGRGSLEVPSDCPALELSLSIPEQGGRRFAVWVDGVAITRLR